MPDLLYEIGTEEVPAGYLQPALAQLAEEVRLRLEELHLEPDGLRTAGTPRRMMLFVEGLPEGQPARTVRTVGPPAHVAYDDDGQPTAAAQGFARSQGVEVGDLRVEETEKGPYVVLVREEPGQAAADLLPGVLKEATAAVTFPKSMRWEASGFTFARPIRGLMALLDDEVLELSIGGVDAGRVTRGHPFLAPEEIELSRADFGDYVDRLREHHVLVETDARREAVRRQINALMREHGSHLQDEALLEEVTNLVEWPHAVEGSFEESFLDVPDPIVTAAMKGHQRYFPVRDGEGRLLPRFVTVANRTGEQSDLVREGNERVLRARLEDARFYWEDDRDKRLEELVEELGDVVFLAGLGDNRQRTERLEELSVRVAEAMGYDISTDHVRRAAHLCKADLLTGLVGEFPDLQGVVGRELALEQDEPEPVARAIAEHYLPAGADDELPGSPEGCALALADKLDVIVGCFALGLLPKGSQDPYALRRNALGILLIIEEKDLELHLGELIDMAREVAARHDIECDDAAAGQIREFFRDRLYHAALDRGFRHDHVRAVLAAGFDDVLDFWNRLDALEECARHDWWPDLVELVDRTFRIQRDVDRVVSVDDDLLEEPLEKELAAALRDSRSEIAGLFKNKDYVAAADLYCSTFARLVHDFFEEVFVNVEDEDVRRNRKSLCAWIYRLFAERFADLYLLETAETEN
ncbi:MAG: glycine--tRNA ligase subunit beta [Candidatus Brocadiia bacterium]